MTRMMAPGELDELSPASDGKGDRGRTYRFHMVGSRCGVWGPARGGDQTHEKEVLCRAKPLTAGIIAKHCNGTAALIGCCASFLPGPLAESYKIHHEPRLAQYRAAFW